MKFIKLYMFLFAFFSFFSYSNLMANEEAAYEVLQKSDIYERSVF